MICMYDTSSKPIQHSTLFIASLCALVKMLWKILPFLLHSSLLPIDVMKKEEKKNQIEDETHTPTSIEFFLYRNAETFTPYQMKFSSPNFMAFYFPNIQSLYGIIFRQFVLAAGIKFECKTRETNNNNITKWNYEKYVKHKCILCNKFTVGICSKRHKCAPKKRNEEMKWKKKKKLKDVGKEHDARCYIFLHAKWTKFICEKLWN